LNFCEAERKKYKNGSSYGKLITILLSASFSIWDLDFSEGDKFPVH